LGIKLILSRYTTWILQRTYAFRLKPPSGWLSIWHSKFQSLISNRIKTSNCMDFNFTFWVLKLSNNSTVHFICRLGTVSNQDSLVGVLYQILTLQISLASQTLTRNITGRQQLHCSCQSLCTGGKKRNPIPESQPHIYFTHSKGSF
jgi:hypothetical protein